MVKVGCKYRFKAEMVFDRTAHAHWSDERGRDCEDGEVVTVERIHKPMSDVVLRHADGGRSSGWIRWFEVCFEPVDGIVEIESVDQKQIEGP